MKYSDNYIFALWVKSFSRTTRLQSLICYFRTCISKKDDNSRYLQSVSVHRKVWLDSQIEKTLSGDWRVKKEHYFGEMNVFLAGTLDVISARFHKRHSHKIFRDITEQLIHKVIKDWTQKSEFCSTKLRHASRLTGEKPLEVFTDPIAPCARFQPQMILAI